MRPLSKWFNTPPLYRVIMIESTAILVITKIAIMIWNFQTIRRVLLKLARIATRFVHPRTELPRVMWAIEVGTTYCPLATTCLIEAVAAEAILMQYGHSAVLCIGARRVEGQFEAHAWLENDSEILIGGPASRIQEYTRFTKFDCLLS